MKALVSFWMALMVLVMLYPTNGLAQEESTLDDLKAPTSPAAYVLGIQPTAVLKPNTYKSLQAGLYSNFVSGDGQAVVPDDFGLEFSPYWTADHALTLDEYLYPKDILKDQIWRNSLFSIASTQNFLLGDSTASNAIAFGYRTSIHIRKAGGKQVKSDIEKAIDRYESTGWVGTRFVSQLVVELQTMDNLNQQKALDKSLEILTKAMNDEGFTKKQAGDVLSIYRGALVNIMDVTQNQDGFVEQLTYIVFQSLKSDELFEELKKEISSKKGLFVDFAYATVINFPSNEFESAVAPRQSFWISPSYKFKNKLDFLTLSGVLRYERFDTDYYEDFFPNATVFRHNRDVGLAASGVFDNFTLDFEAVYRDSETLNPTGQLDINGNETFTKDEDTDFQVVGSFTYRINDNLAITYNLGNQFEPILNPGNTLVSQFGISLSFGAKKNTDVTLPGN
ncbi:MAG: hypothetical protein AAFW89_11720 [Bacteroidota bacterium]